MNDKDDVIRRLVALEGQIRRLHIVLAGVLLAAAATVLSAWRSVKNA